MATSSRMAFIDSIEFNTNNSSTGLANQKETEISEDPFLKSNSINASSVKPWQMEVYLNVSYTKCPAISNIDEATVEQYVEEAFKFMFPEGIPTYYINFYTKTATWKSVVPELCSEFFANKSDWLKEIFKLDYTDATYTDIEDQDDIISNGANELSNELIRNAADLALSISRLLRSFIVEKKKEYKDSENKDKTGKKKDIEKDKITKKKQEIAECIKHDHIKIVIYDMLSYAGVTFLTNGFSKYKFELQKVPKRDITKGGITIKAMPDATLCLKRTPYDICDVPYCPLTVHGPYGKQGLEKLETSESSNTTTGSESELESKIEKQLSIKNESPIIYKKEKEILLKIMRNTPFKLWSEQAFTKVTSQLAVEMYAVLIERARLLESQNRKRMSECMGIFIIDEKIYLAKMQISHREAKLIAGLVMGAGERGPDVCYSDWFFDLRKPNARLGFLIFMYHYKIIVRLCNPPQ